MARPTLLSWTEMALLPHGPPIQYPPTNRHVISSGRYYAPRGTDPQAPHTRDEVYVVTSGRGWFVRGDERVPFEPGDALFVAAGVEHRFEDFTDDFGTWVLFYGPEGGERPAE